MRPLLGIDFRDGVRGTVHASLWTAPHYRIPVTFVMTNNATYRQVKVVRKRVLGDFPPNERHLGSLLLSFVSVRGNAW
jgi:thiamine pyrophosphate-dependent acetolactate synthase large subunit-like protein